MDNNTRALRTRETRLRRAALRQGFTLTKSRRRDHRALDYGLYFLAPAGSSDVTYRGTLDQIEAWLDTPRDQR